MNQVHRIVLLYIVTALPAAAADYPDMVGLWSGNVRVVTTGTGQVAPGGMEISEVHLEVRIEFQERESFVGRSRNSQTPADQPSARVWGTIRSNGREALFVTSTGARGQLWFTNDNTFEYCLTNVQENQATAYCAELAKQAD